MRRSRLPLALAACALAAAACVARADSGSSTGNGRPAAPGLDTLDHLIFIVQENRSFDHYFGTFPGADGIDFRADGKPKACVPDPKLGHCSRPYHSRAQIQEGGPHDHPAAVTDIAGGRMDGFVKAA